MLKTRIYILQFLGIVLLLCGYLLSDQPDNLSVMHFDLSAHSVITNPTKSTNNNLLAQTSVSAGQQNKHKTNVPKYISFELYIPMPSGYFFEPMTPVQHASPLPDTYSYLFYEEINPPPPKAC